VTIKLKPLSSREPKIGRACSAITRQQIELEALQTFKDADSLVV